jgi:hypothetical protein
VAEVVGAVQIHGLQQRVADPGQRTPTLLTIPVRVGDQFGGHEFAQGDLDSGWPDGPAVVGECSGELVGGLPAASRLVIATSCRTLGASPRSRSTWSSVPRAWASAAGSIRMSFLCEPPSRSGRRGVYASHRRRSIAHCARTFARVWRRHPVHTLGRKHRIDEALTLAEQAVGVANQVGSVFTNGLAHRVWTPIRRTNLRGRVIPASASCLAG